MDGRINANAVQQPLRDVGGPVTRSQPTHVGQFVRGLVNAMDL